MSLRPAVVGRVFALAMVAVLGISRPATSAGTSRQLAERYYPEVRLRKMHLVRPDLIPYPISFDVYC